MPRVFRRGMLRSDTVEEVHVEDAAPGPAYRPGLDPEATTPTGAEPTTRPAIEPATDPDAGLGVAPESPSGRSLLAMTLRIVVTVVALWYFSRVVRRIDWTQVWEAVRDITVAQSVVLLCIVVVRQVFNAAPLALFVPRLGLRRALANDLSANLVATAAPPPADIVLRIAMIRSWQIPVADGVGGITLNTLTYYVARFGAPVLGLLLALAVGQVQPSFAYTAVVSGAISLTVVIGLAIATRGEAAASRAAKLAATQVRRIVPKVHPDDWARRATEFVSHVSGRLRARSVSAGACQSGLVLTESLLLLVSLRFAGVPATVATAASVLIALLISYPLTALPFAGVGVLDASVLTILALDHGPYEATAVAGMVIFRTCWVLVPLALGAVTVAWWRRTYGASVDESFDPPDPPEAPRGEPITP